MSEPPVSKADGGQETARLNQRVGEAAAITSEAGGAQRLSMLDPLASPARPWS